MTDFSTYKESFTSLGTCNKKLVHYVNVLCLNLLRCKIGKDNRRVKNGELLSKNHRIHKIHIYSLLFYVITKGNKPVVLCIGKPCNEISNR